MAKKWNNTLPLAQLLTRSPPPVYAVIILKHDYTFSILPRHKLTRRLKSTPDSISGCVAIAIVFERKVVRRIYKRQFSIFGNRRFFTHFISPLRESIKYYRLTTI
jgi:hypothetical protein